MPQCNSDYYIIVTNAFLNFSSYLQTKETASFGNNIPLLKELLKQSMIASSPIKVDTVPFKDCFFDRSIYTTSKDGWLQLKGWN